MTSRRDPDMNFADDVRRRMKTSLDALLKQRSDLARQELDALREAVDQRIAAVTASLASLDYGGSLEPVVENLSRTTLEQAEADHVQLVVARAEGQSRLDAEVATNVALRETLEQAQRQLHTLQGEFSAIQEGHTVIAAQLGNEQTAKAALAEALADVQREMQQVRDEAEARLTTAQETSERLKVEVQEERQRGARALVALDRVRSALQAFEAVKSASDLLETLVVQLSHEFARAAIFFVRASCLKGWRGVGLDPTIAITNLSVPLTIDVPLTRALSDKTSVRLAANADGDMVGLFGGFVASAIAVPILAGGRVIAVAYAEQPQGHNGDDADSSVRMADILGDHVSRSLTVIAARASAASRTVVAPADKASHDEPGDAEPTPQPSSAPSVNDHPALYPGPTRQAHRVRMPEGIEVLVDSSVGVLVDLSSLGAQLLSSKAMRPNHTVRVVLPREEGALPCLGRIVWAACELSRSTGRAMYRAGVHFTGVDARAVDAFLVRYGENPSVSGHLATQ